MKTLINKANPQIRITAPEITTAHPPVSNEGYVYWIPAINQIYNPIDWILVEEEPTDVIKGNLEEIPSNVDLEKEIEMEWDSFNKHVTKYGEESEDVVWLNWFSFTDIATYFYELGLNARKDEQL